MAIRRFTLQTVVSQRSTKYYKAVPVHENIKFVKAPNRRGDRFPKRKQQTDLSVRFLPSTERMRVLVTKLRSGGFLCLDLREVRSYFIMSTKYAL